MPEPLVLAALAATALLAGFVDSIAGGGGLLTLPALLTAGLSPTQALATNKLQSSFGSGSAVLNYSRRGAVEPRTMALPIATTFVGAAIGTLLVQRLDINGLERILPFLLIAVAAYFAFSKAIGEHERHQRLGARPFALSVAPAIGFYDGFFGPGTGSWFALSFVSLRGQGLTRATAATKVLNFTSNVASLTFFVVGGKPVWTVGLTMAVGAFVGARLGSGMVMDRGAALVKPLLVVVSLVMSLRLLLA